MDKEIVRETGLLGRAAIGVVSQNDGVYITFCEVRIILHEGVVSQGLTRRECSPYFIKSMMPLIQ
jgi:hypothetical protein